MKETRKFLLIQRVKGRFLRKVVFKQHCKETDSSVGKESACNAGDPGSNPESGRSTGEGIGYPLQYSWASLMAQLVKKSTCNVRDLSSIPGLGRSPGVENSHPL